VADERVERDDGRRGVGEAWPGRDLETAGNRFSRGTRIEIGIGSLDGNRNLARG
jgi:hypothetical protein